VHRGCEATPSRGKGGIEEGEGGLGEREREGGREIGALRLGLVGEERMPLDV
jgi:hypothetical protein